MGREVRRVPAGWQHPVNEFGDYVPLLDGFNQRLREYKLEAAQWEQGYRRDFSKYSEVAWKPRSADTAGIAYKDWDGPLPERKDYMPDWPEAERTHFQMYETCSEGTPLSPVVESAETLARWLADTGASAFGPQTATYEAWLRVCTGGYAPSAIMILGSEPGLTSGVQGITDMEEK